MSLLRRMIPSRAPVSVSMKSLTSSSPMSTCTTTSSSPHGASPQRAFFSALFGGNFAASDDIQSALEDKKATILDVRGPDEIAATGYWKTAQNHAWVHMPCSPFDASLLEQTAPSLLRDKSAPVVVHCASGRRSSKAKEVLDGLGYERVLNIGGWNEVQQAIADGN